MQSATLDSSHVPRGPATVTNTGLWGAAAARGLWESDDRRASTNLAAGGSLCLVVAAAGETCQASTWQSARSRGPAVDLPTSQSNG